MRVSRILAALLGTACLAAPAAGAHDLTFEERVDAQRAIERVLWSHRIWPEQNPGPKPPLEAVMPDEAIEAKVEDSLRQSKALERLWQRPITADDLQAEIERMTSGSRDPQLLRELFEALDDDPFLVAETLARQTLAERWIREARSKESALPFDEWWAEERETVAAEIDPLPGRYRLPVVAQSACTDDTWLPTKVEAPDSRFGHVAVWTGSEMIFWGGGGGGGVPSFGGRYNPATDTWALTSAGPAGRVQLAAVWTGTEMIVWGGQAYGTYTQTGGRYNPATDAWTATSTGANCPSARYGHTAVWTGTQMVVWGGGATGGVQNTGGRYTPSTDAWTATSTGANVPAGRVRHVTVWTGAVMVVWGGSGTGGHLNTGGRYTPSTDTWATTSTGANVPAARSDHAAAWTGSVMVVWGGQTPGAVNTGGRYNPATNVWQTTSTGVNVPSARFWHTATWTGSEVIVWGGSDTGSTYFNTGGRYDPTTNAWTATSTGANVPSGRFSHTAVWSGSEMIVWGGSPLLAPGGARYNPSANSWAKVSTGPTVPPARASHAAVWTGAEMVVWGGYDGAVTLDSGGRYFPATDSWTPTSTAAGVPPSVRQPTAVWTGTKVIVWGGFTSVTAATSTNTGGRYDPMTNSWQATSTGVNVPSARAMHTAVWTGTMMIVWGGSPDSSALLNTGGRYDPASDTWQATSTGTNVPSARALHTAVWAGTRMVVWGGAGFSDITGGRYDPTTDSWLTTSTGANVPPFGLSYATSVWTGTKMVIWGGNGFTAVNTGARYDPVADSWLPTSTGASCPSPRSRHTAVWTGSEMVVWGGNYDTGGRYDPVADTWVATSTGANLPFARYDNSATWTGSQMIIWGGNPLTATGGLYCACANAVTSYRDLDGDGYGDPLNATTTCDGSIPAGYVAGATDCNDAAAAAHPGGVEVCDGLDNDCDTFTDNVPPPAGVASLTASQPVPGTARLGWTYGGGDETAFDIVRGDLTSLTWTGGDFAAATGACLANDAANPTVDDADALAPGEGFWYLLRAVSCGGNGSYDTGAPSQVDPRDAEIAASGNDCS